MSGHTPGPWSVVAREVSEEDGSIAPRHITSPSMSSVCHLEAQCIAEIAAKEPGTFWDTTPEKEANARLIAAAPELLEALEYIVGLTGYANCDICNEVCNAARAALAKAKGEQP